MKIRHLLLLLATLWCSVAFATNRQDAEIALAQADTAVRAAESADAAQGAPADLRSAQGNLVAARGALERRNWTDSAMNAEKANADADLAAARSREKRATAATAEIEASVETLRREVGRSGGR
ncbi:MAG: hypothetical protein ABI650_04745 [Dokdonella sp.]